MNEQIYALRQKAKENGDPILRDESFLRLIELTKKLKPKHILEVGVNCGISSIAMLLSSKNSKLTGIEINEEKAREASKNFEDLGVSDRAKIFIGDASEIIPVLTGKYDLIFLDGPKGHYYEYVENLLSALNVGGILFADNVLFRGYVSGKTKTPHRFNTTKNSMERFLNRICEDENLKTEIIDIEDGISITEKLK